MTVNPIRVLAESIMGDDLSDNEFITETVMVVRTQSLDTDRESITILTDVDRVATSTIVGMLEMAKASELMPDWEEEEDDE